MEKQKIFIASDHAGFPLKQKLLDDYNDTIDWIDLGPSNDSSVDYPDFSNKLCLKILENETNPINPTQFGVLICGSGVGVNIAANRHKGIRAVLAESEIIAKLSREHNHANVLCLGSRIVSFELAKKIINTFLTTNDDPGERHVKRIQKLS